MPEEQFDLFEALMTQRAIRSLRPDPVPKAVIEKLVAYATKAPSARNSQPWAIDAVDAPEVRAKVAREVQEAFQVIYDDAVSRSRPGDPPPFAALKPLVDHFEQVPVIVFACVVLPEGVDRSQAASYHSSLFPAVQNLLLAARGLGLGAALTRQGLDRVGAILSLPDNVVVAATIPIGYPAAEHYGPTTRKSVAEVLHWNRW